VEDAPLWAALLQAMRDAGAHREMLAAVEGLVQEGAEWARADAALPVLWGAVLAAAADAADAAAALAAAGAREAPPQRLGALFEDDAPEIGGAGGGGGGGSGEGSEEGKRVVGEEAKALAKRAVAVARRWPFALVDPDASVVARLERTSG
jgi:hypothetical protein